MKLQCPKRDSDKDRDKNINRGFKITVIEYV